MNKIQVTVLALGTACLVVVNLCSAFPEIHKGWGFAVASTDVRVSRAGVNFQEPTVPLRDASGAETKERVQVILSHAYHKSDPAHLPRINLIQVAGWGLLFWLAGLFGRGTSKTK